MILSLWATPFIGWVADMAGPTREGSRAQPWVHPDAPALPVALPGFEAVERYIDATTGKPMARIKPGEIYITCKDEWLVTTVGSCVTVCAQAASGPCGGMNHVMFPGRAPSADHPLRYAGAAVQALLSQLRYWSKSQDVLNVWLFGGASTMKSTRSGERNRLAVMRALSRENVTILGQDMGGEKSRRIMFHPVTGQIIVKELGGE